MGGRAHGYTLVSTLGQVRMFNSPEVRRGQTLLNDTYKMWTSQLSAQGFVFRSPMLEKQKFIMAAG